MSFPYGLFLIVVFAAIISSGGFSALLTAMKTQRNTILIVILAIIITSILSIDFRIGIYNLSMNASMLVIFSVIIYSIYQNGLDFGLKNFLLLISVASLFIFVHFSVFLANYILIFLTPYLLPPLGMLLLVLTCGSFKAGFSAIFYGFFLSEIIMLFLQDGYYLSFGGLTGINQFFAAMFYFLFFFWAKGRLLGFSLQDIY